jgi:hypothetical protein
MPDGNRLIVRSILLRAGSFTYKRGGCSVMKRMLFMAQMEAATAAKARELFRAASQHLRQDRETYRLMTFSVHMIDEFLFVYYECIAEEVLPESLCSEITPLLLDWPGGTDRRLFVPMADIFHYSRPMGEEHWRRTQSGTVPWVRIARIKPEMLSRYIFYHYQFQEERPGAGDKYGLIGLHENLLCFYQERPPTSDADLPAGTLTTSHTPDNWREVMIPHFIPWADPLPGQELWKETETLLYVG